MAFDTWVLEKTRETLSDFSLDGVETEESVSSVWEFRGRISLIKRVKDLAARDVAAAIPMAVLSAATNNVVPNPLAEPLFDEVRGDLQVIAVASPHYTCEVRVIERRRAQP
jgi:hypothetical protein